MTMTRPLTAALLALAFAACGAETGSEASGEEASDTAVIGGSADAAGAAGDTGVSDAATAGDAGSSDTASPDSASPDSASPDSASPDSGAADTGSPDTAPTPEYTAISAAQAKAVLDGDPRPLLINVHVPFEGEIVGTDLHVPYNQIAQLEAALGHDKSTWALLYCKTGPMSIQATKKLVQLGYWNLLDMPSGFVTWKAKGYPFSSTKGGK